MKKAKHAIFSCLLALVLFSANAQNGSYDVRFNITEDPVCPDVTLFLDIEIKAASPASEFNLTEQNYRFSFNRDALSLPNDPNDPSVLASRASELTLSGLVTHTPSPMGFSLYSTHSLTGSLDTVVSYNVELAGGDGYPITADTWVPVGRLAFDIVDVDACLNLLWHTSADFPPTFIGELSNGVRATATENLFATVSDCIADLCNLPVELTSFTGEEDGCNIHLFWETATEENSDYFEVQRSSDGINFESIGRVNAAGNSNTYIAYNFIDDAPVLNNYYRLRQVDLDGVYEDFDIIKIESGCFEPGVISEISEVYPNPTDKAGRMNVKLYTNQDEFGKIKIYDIEGRLMSDINTELVAGPNLLEFSVGNLPTGTYLLQVTGNSWASKAQKFIKL